MRSALASGLVIVVLSSVACQIPIVDDGSSGGSNGGNPSPWEPEQPPPVSPGCGEGLPCYPGVLRCCNGAELLTCAGGVYAHDAYCGGSGEQCIPSEGCTCALNEKRCVNGDPKVIQVCRDTGTTNTFETEICPFGTFCNPAMGVCTGCTDDCVPGNMKCSNDGAYLLQCQNVDGCAVFVSVYACSDHAMTCNVPNFSPGAQIDYCINDCGGRGVELYGQECQPDPTHSCGVLICDPATNTLKGDHFACRGVGQPCTANEECTSCVCQSGACVGNQPKHCPSSQGC